MLQYVAVIIYVWVWFTPFVLVARWYKKFRRMQPAAEALELASYGGGVVAAGIMAVAVSIFLGVGMFILGALIGIGFGIYLIIKGARSSRGLSDAQLVWLTLGKTTFGIAGIIALRLVTPAALIWSAHVMPYFSGSDPDPAFEEDVARFFDQTSPRLIAFFIALWCAASGVTKLALLMRNPPPFTLENWFRLDRGQADSVSAAASEPPHVGNPS